MHQLKITGSKAGGNPRCSICSPWGFPAVSFSSWGIVTDLYEE